MARISNNTAFVVDRHSPVPIFRQIYERVRGAITDGQLRPGERLPSARSLAGQLGAARGTVDAAYATLAGEGWIVARPAIGTMVAPHLFRNARVPATNDTTPPSRGPARGPEVEVASPAFRMGLPALDAFPRKLWARLVAREARASLLADMVYPDPAGYWPLREAIAAYLAVARGIACAPQQVFVTGGYQGALGLIARTLMGPGDAVWFEDPGYRRARQGLTAAGARLVPVPVDDEGMRVADAIARAPQARFAVVTPSHQSPLGVALSLTRRLALLSWASNVHAWIIEDDYDGEFHYAGRPLPALKSLDRADVVLYAGSFSKVLLPSLRLGYLIVPNALVDRFVVACSAFLAGNSRLEQAVVARFMEGGHFSRHLKRMRDLYAERRAALAEALATTFSDRLHIDLQSGGMHLLARPSSGIADTALVQLAEGQGLAPASLSRYSIEYDCGQGLLLSFTNVPADKATDAAQTLWRAIGTSL